MRGAPGETGAFICRTCANQPALMTAANNMSLGGTFPELDALTDIEAMLLARVHPLVQVFTLYPSGQLGYVGHIVNLEQKSVEFLEAIPPPPKDLPILLIRRMTREPFSKRARRQPFVANYARLRNALDVLLERHAQYNGMARQPPSVENLEKFYAPDAAGDVALEVQEHLAAEDADPDVDLPLFARWVGNETFAIAGKLAAWLRTEGAARHPGASEWDALRREIAHVCEGIQQPGGGRHPGRFARGATCLPASWIEILARTLELLPEATTGGEGCSCLRDELLAAQVEAAMEAPFVDCGAAPGDEAGDGADAFLEDVVGGIRGCVLGAEDPGGASSASSSSDAGEEPDSPPDVGAEDVSPLRDGASKPEGPGAPPAAGARSGPPFAEETRGEAPRVDPPEKGAALREDTPGLAAAAFVTIFQTGDGDYNEPRAAPVDFWAWGKHVMLQADGRGLRHPRFRYWLLNTLLRKRALGARVGFWQQVPGGQDLTIDMLARDKKRSLVRKMIGVTQAVPGALGERLSMRSDVEAMVGQVEWETAIRGDTGAVLHAYSPSL